MSWWWHLTGQHGPLGWFFSTTGRWYAITSGIGLQFMVVWWRHKNCHQRFCWRIGHHPDPVDGSFKRCSKHHVAAGHGPDSLTGHELAEVPK